MPLRAKKVSSLMAKVKASEPSEAKAEAPAWTWAKTRVQQLLVQVCEAWPVSTKKPEGSAQPGGDQEEDEDGDVFGFQEMGMDDGSEEEGAGRGAAPAGVPNARMCGGARSWQLDTAFWPSVGGGAHQSDSTYRPA